ncbi:hypothetical protein [Mucilaginibacter pedocola]|uniref:hypothetical protein n=1 Tax=Mucilaginibacter pedocola TaxID=1792845 RepID=UPI000993539C|nr:hypothetical protein [Mucilaginibacter pedocola]
MATLKKEYYGFKPNTLNDKQTDAKSAQLDKFWDLAKTDPAAALPCLKEMVLAENNDPYFCFDAATLILTLDKKEEYLDAVLASVKKTDLNNIQGEPYLNVSFLLGNKGKDIAPLAEKLISTPKVHVYLAMHAIDLSAIDASLFLYNLMSIKAAEDNLIGITENGTPTGKHNAAVVLNLLSTDRGDSLLNKLLAENKLADSTKAFVLHDRKEFTKGDGKDKEVRDEATIRNERTKTITGLSDESIERYFALTAELMSVRYKKKK